MATLGEIYNWYMTGKKPTQAQFWASWGSFWHKLEQIPISAISGLTNVLNAKAEKAQFDAHKTANDAHQALFNLKQDLDEKGQANGYVPLNEFVKIAYQYLSIVNDLETGGSTALASAETVKTLKGQIDSINLILTSDDVDLDTVQEIVDAIKEVETSLQTILVNDLTTGGVTKALTAEMGKSLKALIDTLGTNKVDKVAGERLITAAEISKLANAGDMMANTDQPVSGLKTFLAGKFGLRNIANTFTSFFTNSNTASRTYTLQDRNGTLADLNDIASVNTNKMNVPTGGEVNFLPKFLTPTTQAKSRIKDDGTYLGIGSFSPIPLTKNIQLGRDGNKEIGVEQSDSLNKGRDLITSAGRTINFVESSDFLPLGQTFATGNGWIGISEHINGNIYGVLRSGSGGGVFLQTGGVGTFSLFQAFTAPQVTDVTCLPNGNTYVSTPNDIYKQTAGTGSFVAQSTGLLNMFKICSDNSNNIYVLVTGGAIYKKSNDSGSFVSLTITARVYNSIGCTPSGDLYACVLNGDIYKMTGGVGDLMPLGQVSRTWIDINSSSNGVIYANVLSETRTYIYNGTTFNDSGTTLRSYNRLSRDLKGNMFGCAPNDIYKQINDGLGLPNLDGGTKSEKAGTGKGTGKSRWDVWTGQKTTSGTDMQVENKRIEVDELGAFLLLTDHTYADAAAATAAGLRPGSLYWNSSGDLKRLMS